MRIGIDVAGFDGNVAPLGTCDALALVRDAERWHLDSVWLPVLAGGPDPLTVAALAAATDVRLELATGVVRTWGQHPVELARAAMTVADVAAGGLLLGVGVSHPESMNAVYGIDASRPVQHFREYLGVLRALIDTGEVAFEGERIGARARLDRRHPPGRLRLGAAAGGPKMLAAAAAHADVVITNMAGPRLLAERSIPVVLDAARGAGRPAPRVAAIFNVCVTEDPVPAREHVDRVLAGYGANPTYRALLDAEGERAPSGISLIGDADQVTARLDELASIGVTDLIASVVAPDPATARGTEDFLARQVSGIGAAGGSR